MRVEGYEVKRRGKSLEFRAPDQEKFTRSYRLGDKYTEAALREQIEGTSFRTEMKSIPEADHKKINLLVDIQEKINAGKGKGYEQWAKIFNLKEAAKTLNFLLDHGITDYDKLVDCTKTAGQTFDVLSIRIKQLESRMADKAQLKMHIINYSKTRNIYKEYNKSRNKEKYRAAHADEIEKHEAAKAAFDALGGKPIPKVSQLSEEYTMLLAEKRDCYEKYKIARKDMIEYQKAKQNIDKILGFEPLKQENQKDMQR